MKYNHTSLIAASTFLLSAIGQAHSVAQVQTAKRIAESTIVALDPQKGTIDAVSGTDTNARVGDILTYVIQFTPVPNGATRGAGGYITEYVPPNTEVVGVRFIDRDGNTVYPQRGPQMDDGYGPKNSHPAFSSGGLLQGSMSALYADTGVFYSTDARTARFPNDTLISVLNGYQFGGTGIPEVGTETRFPTGAGQLEADLLFTGPPYPAHNKWDYIQALAFGVKDGDLGAHGACAANNTFCLDGRGNTPFGYGSAVAGPETYYRFERVLNPACDDGAGIDYPDGGCASVLDHDETTTSDAPVGPWRRIRCAGSEIGSGDPADDQWGDLGQGNPVRVGERTELGWDLSADNPLPAGTNAVRFAVGELVVGQEYLVEISLRIKALPLDSNTGDDTNCAEVFGGDAAQPQNGQDNTWRYYVPSSSCVSLNLVFDLSVDKLLAINGETITYTLRIKNLSTDPQTNVNITTEYDGGQLDTPVMLMGEHDGVAEMTPTPTVGAGGTGQLISWPEIPTLAPGEEYIYRFTMDAADSNDSSLVRASYLSTEQTDPFSVQVLTTLEPIAMFNHTATVTQPMPSAVEGNVVTYTVVIENTGTGAAQTDANDYVRIGLPLGMSFCDSGTGCSDPTLDTTGGATGSDPGWNPTTERFESLATIAAGESSTLTFQARIDDNEPDLSGIYTIDVQTQYKNDKLVEKTTFGLAPLLINAIQSEPPVLTSTILAGATNVHGTTSEGAAATVRVFVNGNLVDEVIAGAGGVFTAAVPTLYAGQRITATAIGAGEVESEPSESVTVEGTSAGSGPNIDPPECSDGVDNDEDGDVDFPEDKSCTTYLDETEGNIPECDDGVDNDDDGKTDADDPDCKDGNSETGVPACADGIDNDDDDKIDYPTDPGCSGPTDNDESMSGTQSGSGGGSNGGDGDGDSGTPGTGSTGSTPPDLGGVETNGGGDSVGDVPGCGCRTIGTKSAPHPAQPLALFSLAGLSLLLRRRRHSQTAGNRAQ